MASKDNINISLFSGQSFFRIFKLNLIDLLNQLARMQILN